MNLNFRRTALLVGICSAVSLTYTPQLFAASVDAIDAVQQAKKITGTVTDAMEIGYLRRNVGKKHIKWWCYY